MEIQMQKYDTWRGIGIADYYGSTTYMWLNIRRTFIRAKRRKGFMENK